MTHYSIQPRNKIFNICVLLKNMSKNIDKNISKNLIGNYSQKRLDHSKQLATDALKTTPKRAIEKIAEATGDLICNKTADRTTKVSKTSPQNNSEKITNEHNKKIPKERYISPEKRKKIIDDLRLIQ